VRVFLISLGIFIASFIFEHVNTTYLEHVRYRRPWRAAFAGMRVDIIGRMVGILIYTEWAWYLIPDVVGGFCGTLYRMYVLKRRLKQKREQQ